MMPLDIYSRPLPVPKWHTINEITESGYYLWADNPKDWDIAKMIGLIKIESGGRVWFECRVPGSESRTALTDLPAASRLFGPFRVGRPTWE